MRKIFFSILVLAGLMTLTACSQKNPQISVESERIEFGDVVNGEIVSKDLRVRNKGEAPLVVEAVSTSCGCTTATLKPMTIQPGGEGLLHVEFDSGAHGPELTGEFVRQVFIASNDPQQPEVVVELIANVVAP
jgi:LEA14-like dessication related protein